jgi:geranylgeranylglycerol-phosphate geranylgeranyltransferase
MSILTINQEKEKTKVVEEVRAPFFLSQALLFQSRKKWGIIYALATVAGLFSIPGGVISASSEVEAFTIIARTLPLPAASFLIIVGMYILNDLIDADLDRANGKKRPIPTGRVSKKQAWVFVSLTNGAGMMLAVLTLNPASMVITSMVAAIGLMYSAPKIALKDRFVIKTLAIAAAIVLCALLGATSTFGLGTMDNIFVPVYISLLLGSMVFITSPFNDLGDVAGDKAAGRRTIPIVIGRENTVKLAIALGLGIVGLSWLFFGLSAINLQMAVAASLVGILTSTNMSKTLKRLDDTDFVRRQHKKSLPLHILLQSAIIIGMLLI